MVPRTYPRIFSNRSYLLHSLDVRSAMQKSILGLWSLTMVLPIKLPSFGLLHRKTILTVFFFFSYIKHLALRAAASAVKQQDDKRLFHNAAMRRRRKEMSDQMDVVR